MNGLTMAMAALCFGAALQTPAPIEHQVRVAAPLEAVWDSWTTEAGLTAFFAPAVNLEPRVDGAYEVLFAPDAPAGQRGAEGTRLMALEPPRRLAFTWDAPPAWPQQRAQRTMVEIRLRADGEGTVVLLRQFGFGDGPQWQEVRDYFDSGWASVLARLVRRFEVGPVDWQSPSAFSGN